MKTLFFNLRRRTYDLTVIFLFILDENALFDAYPPFPPPPILSIGYFFY